MGYFAGIDETDLRHGKGRDMSPKDDFCPWSFILVLKPPLPYCHR
jgi:hypothetical protein